MPSRLAVVVVALIGVAACSDAGSDATRDGPRIGAGELLGEWVNELGDPVPDGVTMVDGEFPLVLHVQRGPEHCEWQDALLMSLALPVGRVAVSFDEDVHQYVRDPSGVVSAALRSGFDTDAELPATAEFSGLSTGDIELWFDEETVEDFVFITDGRVVERWPRANPPALCA